jgi:hypothetical protein
VAGYLPRESRCDSFRLDGYLADLEALRGMLEASDGDGLLAKFAALALRGPNGC